MAMTFASITVVTVNGSGAQSITKPDVALEQRFGRAEALQKFDATRDAQALEADEYRDCPFPNGENLTKFLLDNSDGENDPPALDAKTLSVDKIVIFPTPPGKAFARDAFPGKQQKLNEDTGESDGVFHIGFAKGDGYYIYAIDTSDICWDPENAERCAHRGKSGPPVISARGIHVTKIVIESGNLIIGDEK